MCAASCVSFAFAFGAGLNSKSRHGSKTSFVILNSPFLGAECVLGGTTRVTTSIASRISSKSCSSPRKTRCGMSRHGVDAPFSAWGLGLNVTRSAVANMCGEVTAQTYGGWCRPMPMSCPLTLCCPCHCRMCTPS